jgi:hypothetical protein
MPEVAGTSLILAIHERVLAFPAFTLVATLTLPEVQSVSVFCGAME